MIYNPFRKLARALAHGMVVSDVSRKDILLAPERIINRVIYGPDYNPSDVGFNRMKMLSHIVEA